jgi:hypothetical protein
MSGVRSISLIDLWNSFRQLRFVSDDFEGSLEKVTINYGTCPFVVALDDRVKRRDFAIQSAESARPPPRLLDPEPKPAIHTRNLDHSEPTQNPPLPRTLSATEWGTADCRARGVGSPTKVATRERQLVTHPTKSVARAMQLAPSGGNCRLSRRLHLTGIAPGHRTNGSGIAAIGIIRIRPIHRMTNAGRLSRRGCTFYI